MLGTSRALDATGGGIGVGGGGKAILTETYFWSNEAGGLGLYESYGSYAAAAQRNRKARAAHIDTGGITVLQSCSISHVDAIPGSASDLAMANRGSAFIVLRSSGQLTLVGSSFTSARPNTAMLVITQLPGTRSEAILRRCRGENVTLVVTDLSQHNTTQLAIVNSSFLPPLAASVVTVQPPHCDTIVAGQSLCDPRALCEPGLSGGVACACVGDGISVKPGAYPDGSLCEQATGASLHARSQHVTIKAQKPGNYSEKMQIVVQAYGERPFSALYSLIMRRSGPRFGDASINSSRAWNPISEQHLFLDGHHLIFDESPSLSSEFDLSGEERRFTKALVLWVQLRLDCSEAQRCIEDGDIVETEIKLDISAASGPSHDVSTVRITTEVQSLPSCQNSRVAIDRDARTTTTSPLSASLLAFDVDNIPIKYTAVEFEALFGTEALPVAWDGPGHNKYVVQIPPNREPGDYILQVSVPVLVLRPRLC